MGQVPTSVCVVTTADEDGPTGMTVGSFTSIPLDPPLVGFSAHSGSATVQKLRKTGRFTVNLLSDRQGDLCMAFAGRSANKFEGVPLVAGAHPNPRLAEALGWIDCEIDSVLTIGDHDAVVGHVTDLVIPTAAHRPLVFFRGALCQLASRTVPRLAPWQREHYSEW